MIGSRIAGLVSGASLLILAAACTTQATTGQATGNTPSPASSNQTSTPSTTIAPPPPLATTTPSATVAPAATTTTTTTAVARPAAVPECTARTLSLRLGPSDDGAGHHFQELLFTNTGRASCFIVGFPGVSYVDFDGHQIGRPAVRDGAEGGRVTLGPGQVSSADVSMADPGVFDPGACAAQRSAGLRVYPPDSFAAMFLPYPTTACSGPIPESQLQVRTIVRGTGTG